MLEDQLCFLVVEAQSCLRRDVSRQSVKLVSFMTERKLPEHILQYAPENKKKVVNQIP